ncbi:MAG: VOC family protein [Planctomycetota bacterium]
MSRMVWTDLSSYGVEAAERFYGRVLGWGFDGDGSGYRFCTLKGEPVAGLYETPAFFQKIKMPSFWMTYFRVDGLDTVVATARERGGRVELEETTRWGRIALIRDPLGAGFTCYEGDQLNGKPVPGVAGAWCWSGLYVSDISAVSGFYEAIFGWRFGANTDGCCVMEDGAGGRVGFAWEVPNSVKGKEEYWGVSFGVADTQEAERRVTEAGGEVVYRYADELGQHRLARDDQGAAFYLTAFGGA